MSSTIHVSGISAQTSEADLKSFLSFCGKISSIQLSQDGDAQKATVTFEKASAAKTALLLDSTQLANKELKITSDDSGASSATTQQDQDDHPLSQEAKPRTRVVAEYLASGYKLGDGALSRAIELDNTHGFSKKFLSALQNIDTKTGASTQAQKLDEKYQVTSKAQQSGSSVWNSLSSYYEKFSQTETGQKVHHFYTNSEKNVKDIHDEALRLSGLKEKYSGSTTGSEGSSEKKPTTTVPGTEGTKTTCGCGGAESVCGCKPGQCLCSNCPVSSGKEGASTGPADVDIAASANVAPLGEKKV